MKKRSLKILASLRPGGGITIMALLLSATLASCERGCGEGDDPKPDILWCDTEVTAESAGCASGAFQNHWLKLDNGEWLQPFENQTSITNIESGQRYRIGYELMNRDNRYDGQVVCLALPPNGKAIRLLCITPIEETGENCDTYVTARNVNCSVGAWGDTWLQLDNGKYLQPWQNNTGTQELVEGARYKIAYAPMTRDSRYDDINVCDAMPLDSLAWNPDVVSVNCLEAVSGK